MVKPPPCGGMNSSDVYHDVAGGQNGLITSPHEIVRTLVEEVERRDRKAVVGVEDAVVGSNFRW